MPTRLERRAAIQHRREQLRLTALTLVELRDVFGLFDPDDMTDTFRPWLTATTAVTERARARHVDLAAAYLTVVDIAPTVAPPPLNRDALTTSLRVTGPIRVERYKTLGAPLSQYLGIVEQETSRAAARHAANGAREHILDHVADSDRRLRYRRLAAAGACDFCKMLAGRGAVYHTERTAGFDAHDGCACMPAVEGGGPRL